MFFFQRNSRLTAVNFAWNGFGYEGCAALAQALRQNSTLQVLDLTNNRIHPPALLQLLPGITGNKSISMLLLGLNPIPAHLTSYLLDRIWKWKHGNLRELDLQGQSLASQNKPFFTSTSSLASTQSLASNMNLTSRGRGRKLKRNLEGTQVTAFSSPSTSQGRQGGRQWRPWSQPMNKTLTVSIDNISTISSEAPKPQNKRRRQWRRRKQQLSSNSSSTESSPAPSLSEQIQKLKPAESTKYVFQKRAFSAASTSLSLSERFSWGSSTGEGGAREDALGRKVFL